VYNCYKASGGRDNCQVEICFVFFVHICCMEEIEFIAFFEKGIA
jgi:hypothetical protein